MTRKINKKVIVAIFMAVVMTVSLVSTASAIPSIGTVSGSCSHGRGIIGAYTFSNTNLQVQLDMEPHSQSTMSAVGVGAMVRLSNGSLKVLSGSGQLINGWWSARINYTAPTGTTIVGVTYVTFSACSWSRTIS